ncbi:HGGxSTG domain-containing protein [Bacillus sp. C1]
MARRKLPKQLREFMQKAEQEIQAGDNEELIKVFKRDLKVSATICGAVQKTGKICARKPVIHEDGSTNGRCVWHGSGSKGATTEEGREKAMANLNPKAATIHGIYSKDFRNTLTKEEVELYNYFVDYFCEHYEVDPFNLSLVDRYAMNYIKVGRLDSTKFLSDSQSYNDPEIKLIRYIETLGLNNKFKMSKENKDNPSKVDLNALFDLGNEQ